MANTNRAFITVRHCSNAFNPHNNPKGTCHDCLHFIHGEMQAQRLNNLPRNKQLVRGQNQDLNPGSHISFLIVNINVSVKLNVCLSLSLSVCVCVHV